MNVQVTKHPKSLVELIIEESSENVAKYRNKVIKEAWENIEVKGFRKGANIPEDIIIRQVWEPTILQKTIEKAIDGIYRDTLRKEKLMPVSQAEIKEVISESPLKVKVQLEVLPSAHIKDSYRDIKIPRETLAVSDQEVENALDDIQTRFTQFHDADESYAAQMGDKVTIDTDWYDESGEKLDATSMRDYPLVLWSNMLVPGFEEDMLGMKTGETRELDVHFPNDYHNADFAGKKTKFSVTAKKIEKAQKPDFTPEFIEGLRGKKLDLDGFKELIRAELLDTKESNNAMEREFSLVEKLLEHTDLDIGDKLLSEQTDRVFEEIKENIGKDGVKVADYLASLGLSEEEYKKQHVESTALKRLQWELIFSEILRKEDTQVSDEEMNEEIAKIIARYESEDVKKRLEELYVPWDKYYEELKRRMAMRKIIDSFFETTQ